MNNSRQVKKMVGVSTLAAIVVVLQLISNYIQFGQVSITLALIPLVVGAIIYGPMTGFILGLFMGILILTAPSTATFANYNLVLTVLLCLLKTGLAGLACGWAYKGIIRLKFLKKAAFPTAVIVATLLAPLVNTGLFILGTSTMFQGLSVDGNVLVPSENFGSAFMAALGFVVLTNFLIEFSVSAVASPIIVYLFKILGKHFDLGFAVDFKDNRVFNDPEDNAFQSEGD